MHCVHRDLQHPLLRERRIVETAPFSLSDTAEDLGLFSPLIQPETQSATAEVATTNPAAAAAEAEATLLGLFGLPAAAPEAATAAVMISEPAATPEAAPAAVMISEPAAAPESATPEAVTITEPAAAEADGSPSVDYQQAVTPTGTHTAPAELAAPAEHSDDDESFHSHGPSSWPLNELPPILSQTEVVYELSEPLSRDLERLFMEYE